MANTYKERLVAGIKRLGWSVDWMNKSRYTAFTKAGASCKLFVGPNGALRKGECATRSYSIGDAVMQSTVYKQILALGDKELAGVPREAPAAAVAPVAQAVAA